MSVRAFDRIKPVDNGFATARRVHTKAWASHRSLRSYSPDRLRRPPRRLSGCRASGSGGPTSLFPPGGIRIPLESGAGAAANLRAYTVLDETSVLTHHSGGRIWELGLPPWLQEDWRIHVAREREGSRPRRQNVVGHRMTFKPGEVVMHDGVRVTSPARTWLDLANLLTVDELIAVGDSVVTATDQTFPGPRSPWPRSTSIGAAVRRRPSLGCPAGAARQQTPGRR